MSEQELGRELDMGGSVDKTEASLLIYSESITPDDITLILGCKPTYYHYMGKLTRSGKAFPQHCWGIEEEGNSEPEEMIERLLKQVNFDNSRWMALAHKCDALISCTLTLRAWTRGFELSSTLLQILGKLNLKLGFSIYFIKDDSEPLYGKFKEPIS